MPVFDPRKSTKPIEEDDARALLAPYADAIAEAEENDAVDGVIDPESLFSGEMRVHDRPLVLDALHLAAGGPTLIVRGDLKVRGLIQQDFRAGFLIVLGDLEAENLVTTAQLFVSGKLTVKNTLFGNCTNYGTIVLGDVEAKVLVSAKEHSFCFYAARAIPRIVDCDGDTPNLDDRTDGEDALVDGIDKGHDAVAVANLLRAGKPVLKT